MDVKVAQAKEASDAKPRVIHFSRRGPLNQGVSPKLKSSTKEAMLDTGYTQSPPLNSFINEEENRSKFQSTTSRVDTIPSHLCRVWPVMRRTPVSQPHVHHISATVNKDGSPIAQRTRGADAKDVSYSIIIDDVDPVLSDSEDAATPKTPHFGGDRLVQRSSHKLSQNTSSRASGIDLLFASSTSKAVPSSPHAPSRMLQDMVGHHELSTGEFINLQNAEVVKSGLLEDPFSTDQRKRGTLFSNKSEGGKTGPPYTYESSLGDSSASSKHPQVGKQTNQKTLLAKGEKIVCGSSQWTSVSSTPPQSAKLKECTRMIQTSQPVLHPDQCRVLESMCAVVNHHFDQLISTEDLVSEIVSTYEHTAGTLIEQLKRTHTQLHDGLAARISDTCTAQEMILHRALEELEGVKQQRQRRDDDFEVE